MRRENPDAEDLLWAALKACNARGYHFRRREFYRSFHLDFVEHDILLVIDLRDGGPAADGGPETFSSPARETVPPRLSPDVAREHVLHAAGYTILHFWRGEVEANPGGALSQLCQVLEDRPPPRDDPGSGRVPECD